MRPVLHYTPRRGWMNDPNGLIQHRGVHHLFYQTNPLATDFGAIHWGHAISTDLLAWSELPPVLTPGVPIGEFDRDGCWSGVAVRVDDAVALVYSGLADAGIDRQLPCLAWADDDGLLSFTKDPASPLVTEPPSSEGELSAFRDHCVLPRPGGWSQLVGGGTTHGGGCVFAYWATDLHRWDYRGRYADAGSTPIPGRIWECPDVFTSDGRTVLVVSVIEDGPTSVWWSVGDEVDGTFAAAGSGLLDHGDRFYAPQSYPTDDGRRIMFGWLQTHLDAGAAGADWMGVMSLPRELGVRDGRLWQEPTAELLALRSEVAAPVVTAAPGGHRVLLPAAGVFELELARESITGLTGIGLRDSGTGTTVEIDVVALLADDAAGPLRLFFDHGIVETFCSGRAAATSCVQLSVVDDIMLHGCPAAGPESVRVFELSGGAQSLP